MGVLRLRKLSGEPPGWVTVVAFALLAALSLPLARRELILSDEGFLLHQALDILHGKVLYRDMVAIIAPGVWLFVAGLFSVVEPSVIASRMLALAAHLATVGFAYRIVCSLTSRIWGLGAIAVLMIFTVWAFPAWTFAWYSPFAVLFALGGLERLLAWRRSHRSRDLVWAGLLLGLSISCKQNYGLFATLGALPGLLAVHLEMRKPLGAAVGRAVGDALVLGGGVLIVVLPLLAYFAAEGALGDFVETLILQPTRFASTSDIPYPSASALWAPHAVWSGIDRLTYLSVPFVLALAFAPSGVILLIVERLHMLLYWAPPLVFALGAGLGLAPIARGRPAAADLILVTGVCGLVFLGVFPRADFNHLINVYQPVIVAGVLVAHRLLSLLPTPRPRWARIGIGVGWLGLAAYALVAVHWYDRIVSVLDTEVSHRRGGVLVSSLRANEIDRYVAEIQRSTREGEPVLTIPDLAMYNFLAERPLPSPYYEMYEHMMSHDRGRGVVDGAEAHRVRLAVARYDNFFSHRTGLRAYAPDLVAYLRTHFALREVQLSGSALLLERRTVPLSIASSTDVLSHCDVAPQGDDRRVILEHLLFASLYHHQPDEDPGGGAPQETRCRVTIPERGTLHLRIGHRRVGAAQRGAWVRAEILAAVGRGRERLLDERFWIRPWTGTKIPMPKEFHLDLSHLAGREVTLIFRSARRGWVRKPSGALKGFATIWQDPRIEVRNEAGPDDGSTASR